MLKNILGIWAIVFFLTRDGLNATDKVAFGEKVVTDVGFNGYTIDTTPTEAIVAETIATTPSQVVLSRSASGLTPPALETDAGYAAYDASSGVRIPTHAISSAVGAGFVVSFDIVAGSVIMDNNMYYIGRGTLGRMIFINYDQKKVRIERIDIW